MQVLWENHSISNTCVIIAFYIKKISRFVYSPFFLKKKKGTIPAIMGDAIASYVLAHLAGQPLHCEATSRCNGEKFQTYFNRVKSREKKIFGAANEDFMVDPTDIAYLIKEVFRSRSVASGRTTNLTLTRWDKRFPASVKNLVLLTQGEAEAHDKLDGLDKVEPVLRQKVETLLAEVEYS